MRGSVGGAGGEGGCQRRCDRWRIGDGGGRSQCWAERLANGTGGKEEGEEKDDYEPLHLEKTRMAILIVGSHHPSNFSITCKMEHG